VCERLSFGSSRGVDVFHLLELDGGIMDYLSRVAEKVPIWNAGGFLVFAGVCIWYLMRLDKEARREVEARRHWWGSTSTFESEFKEYRSRMRLGYLLFTTICVVCATVIVCAHVLVR
jgi:hypothetical protein